MTSDGASTASMDGRVVVVTGGTSGIGMATVEMLVRRGAIVAVLARDPAKGAALAAKTGAQVFHADVSDAAAVRGAFAEIERTLGAVTGLVANAGVADVEGPLHRMDDATWDHVMSVDLRGTYLVTREALRSMMQAGGGAIVAVSSVVVAGAIPGAGTAYHAAKGGIEAFVRSIAVDYALHGIRCNAVAPGATETPLMWANVRPETVDEERRRVEQQVPLGRLAAPADIAYAIAWLLSDEAAYVTGATLLVDGGVAAKSVLTA